MSQSRSISNAGSLSGFIIGSGDSRQILGGYVATPISHRSRRLSRRLTRPRDFDQRSSRQDDGWFLMSFETPQLEISAVPGNTPSALVSSYRANDAINLILGIPL